MYLPAAVFHSAPIFPGRLGAAKKRAACASCYRSKTLEYQPTTTFIMLKKSDYLILLSALIAMALSIYLWFSGNKEAGLFTGLWVPSLLCFGIYFKTQIRGGGHDHF